MHRLQNRLWESFWRPKEPQKQKTNRCREPRSGSDDTNSSVRELLESGVPGIE